jgi:hypothetical protein
VHWRGESSQLKDLPQLVVIVCLDRAAVDDNDAFVDEAAGQPGDAAGVARSRSRPRRRRRGGGIACGDDEVWLWGVGTPTALKSATVRRRARAAAAAAAAAEPHFAAAPNEERSGGDATVADSTTKWRQRTGGNALCA